MSQHPRLGAGGHLRRSLWLRVSRRGEVVGVHADGARDPFERTEDDLLLAEAFARFDFGRPRKAQQWLLTHGVIDLASMFPRVYAAGKWPPGVQGFGDRMSDVIEQQRNVRWHLHALARLSIERPRAGKRHRSHEPHEGWDRRWGRAAVRVPDGTVFWMGASSWLAGRITPYMQRYARYEDVPERPPPSRYGVPPALRWWLTDEWWPAAHAAWQEILRDGVPVLWAPDTTQFDDFAFGESPADPGVGHEVIRGIGTDWHGLMEVERRLLIPYVRAAAERVLELVPTRPAPPPPEDDPNGDRWYGTIEVQESRWWHSLLAPVYLQLFEALRRISDGKQGATFCRECSQPFLTLDARRSTFCTDRERHRWSQRDRRSRLEILNGSLQR